jgi:hypothetical protein
MTIEEVIDRSILAIFKDRTLSRQMVLKGGSAIRMLEHDSTRLSIDADFSIRGSIKTSEPYFRKVARTLSREFGRLAYNVIDFRPTQRPRQLKPTMPAWWRGWLCEFKLVARADAAETLEVQRRRALIPKGASSSIIEIEISEHEYCAKARTRSIRGVVVHGYTRELLVLEKLRAICQQHPTYRFRSNKNRARDFYDIHRLCSGRMGAGFLARCRKHLPPVFAAKEVPLSLLASLWDEEFIAGQRRGFPQVVDSVTGTPRTFDVYVEFLRYLVQRIHPTASPSQRS